jgi:acetyl-CoA synthetase
MSQNLAQLPEHSGAEPGARRSQYSRRYAESLQDPDGFWGRVGKRLAWSRPYTKVKDVSFREQDFRIRWYEDGQLNVAYNCLDRHLAERGHKTAILWEGDDPSQSRCISYRELYERVCQCANALADLGVRQGDRVTIYLPMIPEIAIAMLACARIGAVHSVVFAGFSPDSLAGRIADCQSVAVITADEGVRGGKKVHLKSNVDIALTGPGTECVKHVLVVKRTGAQVPMYDGRDLWFTDFVDTQPKNRPPQMVDAEDPLFILYTSGSTGKPKGVLHTSGGYLTYAAFTHEEVFDLRENDIYWCTADCGWVTGHSYLVYGPLANGATTLMFEGVPTYPDSGRFWEIIDKHAVSVFYTAPTALRALMREGDAPVRRWSRKSLRVLGTVGEPINPQAWEWYYRVVGDSRCPIVDTWWQTETGGVLITPLPDMVNIKPGSATLPFFGIQPAIVDGAGNILSGACEGNLVLLDSWPGQMRTVYGDNQRFIDTYFKTFPGMYFTGDGARRDEDGHYWITGRVDDVLNVAGHRLGTAEIESAMVAHPQVAEAAVVGCPHDIKGQGIYVFVTLVVSAEPTEALRNELRNWVRREIGPIATPDFIQWAPSLPKTRSGKIMRRILRKIAANEHDQLGDISTLAEPGVVKGLIQERLNS